MNMALGRSYRLVARGGAGLVCDQDGVALGAVDLVRAGVNEGGSCEVRSLDEIGQILEAGFTYQSGIDMPFDDLLSAEGATDSDLLRDLIGLDVLDYSKKDVVAAGRVIADRRPWTPEHQEELITAFRLAHDWRLAHIVPMRVVRNDLSAKTKKLRGRAITAARLKRMQSIRRKLRRQLLTLYQVQDIAGCRAIVDSMGTLQALVDYYRSGKCAHAIYRENDYVTSPKRGGYRSHHIVLKFKGSGDLAKYNRQTVEVQLRTALQHTWATAVETVGLVRGEDLKGGNGDAGWLRFFEIMSSEFAAEEKCPSVPGVPEDAEERLSELVELERRLRAVRTMESYAYALNSVAGLRGAKGMTFLIRYDNATKRVAIAQHSSFAQLAEDLYGFETTKGADDTVLVEVDKAADLREAYPNYFLDVKEFVRRLKLVLEGSVVPKPSRKAERAAEAAKTNPAAGIDLSWWFKDN